MFGRAWHLLPHEPQSPQSRRSPTLQMPWSSGIDPYMLKLVMHELQISARHRTQEALARRRAVRASCSRMKRMESMFLGEIGDLSLWFSFSGF